MSDHNVRNRERSSSGINGEKRSGKGVGGSEQDFGSKGAKMKRVGSSKRGLYFLGVCLVGFVVWSMFFNSSTSTSHSVNWWDENVHLRLGLQKLTFAVIIDAGSTGTRVLGFEFHQSLKGEVDIFLNVLFFW